MEREVGRGIGMRNTCNSMVDSCQCMQKPLQYCKVIRLPLIKINVKIIINKEYRRLLGGPAVRTQCSHPHELWFDPCSRN